MVIREKKCPPHYWIVDSNNVAKCKWCGKIRDFGRLLQGQGVFAVAGRRGAKAREEVLGKKSKQSAAMKKLWQTPEYQAKMSDRKGRNLKYE